jgi:hypothetical protein
MDGENTVEPILDYNRKVLKVPGDDLREGINAFQLVARSACSSKIMEQKISAEKVVITPPSVFSSHACQQGSVILKATSDQPDVSYYWYAHPDDTISLYNGNEFVTPLLSKSKTYYVSAFNSSGCESNRVNVEAMIIPYDDVMIAMEEGVLRSSYEEGNQWFFNGETLSGEIHPTFTPLESGVYTVEVAIGTCTSSDTYNYVISGFQEGSEGAEILIYPNPSNDIIFIRFRSEVNDELINVFTATGTSVDYICTPVSDDGLCAISLAGWPAGLYTLLFKLGGEHSFVRFVKR